ncbi:hypothetical protein ACFL5G_00770 [Candidatus Margulisiibacteriota bacterium]
MLKRAIVVILFLICILTVENVTAGTRLSLYPLANKFGPIMFKSADSGDIREVKVGFDDSVGIGIEVVNGDPKEKQFCYGLEYFTARLENIYYRSRNLSFEMSDLNFKYEVITPFIKWRNPLENKDWFYSFELSVPFIKYDEASNKPMNQIVSWRTPLGLGIACGSYLSEDSIWELAYLISFYTANTVGDNPRAVDDPTPGYDSIYQNQTITLSLKYYLDI